MKTAIEILKTVNQYEYDVAAPLLETMLSKHLRGRVYLGVIHYYVENLYFEREFNSKLYDAHINPKAAIDSYIEKWGMDAIALYLREREDVNR